MSVSEAAQKIFTLDLSTDSTSTTSSFPALDALFSLDSTDYNLVMYGVAILWFGLVSGIIIAILYEVFANGPGTILTLFNRGLEVSGLPLEGLTKRVLDAVDGGFANIPVKRRTNYYQPQHQGR